MLWPGHKANTLSRCCSYVLFSAFIRKGFLVCDCTHWCHSVFSGSSTWLGFFYSGLNTGTCHFGGASGSHASEVAPCSYCCVFYGSLKNLQAHTCVFAYPSLLLKWDHRSQEGRALNLLDLAWHLASALPVQCVWGPDVWMTQLCSTWHVKTSDREAEASLWDGGSCSTVRLPAWRGSQILTWIGSHVDWGHHFWLTLTKRASWPARHTGEPTGAPCLLNLTVGACST